MVLLIDSNALIPLFFIVRLLKIAGRTTRSRSSIAVFFETVPRLWCSFLGFFFLSLDLYNLFDGRLLSLVALLWVVVLIVAILNGAACNRLETVNSIQFSRLIVNFEVFKRWDSIIVAAKGSFVD